MKQPRPDYLPPPAGPVERWINFLFVLIAMPLFAWYCVARIPSRPAGGDGVWNAEITAWEMIRPVDLRLRRWTEDPNGVRPGLLAFLRGKPIDLRKMAAIQQLAIDEADVLREVGETIDRVVAARQSLDLLPGGYLRYFNERVLSMGLLTVVTTAGEGADDVCLSWASRCVYLSESQESVLSRHDLVVTLARHLEERTYEPDALGAWIATLAENDGLQIRGQLLGGRVDVERVEAALDGWYTRDANGSGWFVPTSLPRKRHAIWNVASGLWDSRQATRARVMRYVRDAERYDKGATEKSVQDLADTSPRYAPVTSSNPLYHDDQVDLGSLLRAHDRANTRRVLVVLASLAQQRARLGHWPTPIQVDRSNWPVNLDTGAPFRYELVDGSPLLPIDVELPFDRSRGRTLHAYNR